SLGSRQSVSRPAGNGRQGQRNCRQAPPFGRPAPSPKWRQSAPATGRSCSHFPGGETNLARPLPLRQRASLTLVIEGNLAENAAGEGTVWRFYEDHPCRLGVAGRRRIARRGQYV